MSRTRNITLITTGGTIDKVYGRGAGVRELSFGERPAILDIVGLVDYPVDFIGRVYTLMKKDSLDITDEDRLRINEICRQSHNRVVITHGTDTMIETASTIAPNPKQVIVLTGALRPACMKDSDAEFNVGCAIAAVQVLQPGKYIVMSGQVFAWDKCRKNPETGSFERIN